MEHENRISARPGTYLGYSYQAIAERSNGTICYRGHIEGARRHGACSSKIATLEEGLDRAESMLQGYIRLLPKRAVQTVE
ncbi:hypothetical protein [Stenotrophomonas maltophilia]|uniref:hypothetical protein n=1 Tax=Stenotrophomonas maltophilia TaxID=40324 RepID=UPI002A9397F2|nr:hypothetical protein [Stenotrophomonas maltophilia]